MEEEEQVKNPLINSEQFIPYDEFKFLIDSDYFPLFSHADCLRNKMKTKRLVISGAEYRVYYKYSHDLKTLVYYINGDTSVFRVVLPDGSGKYQPFWVLIDGSGGKYQPFIAADDTIIIED